MTHDRYISVKDLVENIAKIKDLRTLSTKTIGEAIDATPTANVIEIKRGAWIVKTETQIPLSRTYIRKQKTYSCPYCRKEYRQKMNFCGNCGAILKGE